MNKHTHNCFFPFQLARRVLCLFQAVIFIIRRLLGPFWPALHVIIRVAAIKMMHRREQIFFFFFWGGGAVVTPYTLPPYVFQ